MNLIYLYFQIICFELKHDDLHEIVQKDSRLDDLHEILKKDATFDEGYENGYYQKKKHVNFTIRSISLHWHLII